MTGKPFLPSAQNPLRIYTDLVLAPNDQPLILEEFAGLGPATTAKQLTEMWMQSHISIEWTICIVDQMDFVDTVTATSSKTQETDRFGNFRSWSIQFAENFYNAILNTTGTLLILMGHREPAEMPYFWHGFDRTVIVKAPDFVPFN